MARLGDVCYRLLPYEGEAPKPTGKQAADAAQALTGLANLLAEQSAARRRVTSARGVDQLGRTW
ncbi:hypothetical protein ACWIFI_15400 [Streptomyces albidoflavus]